MQTLLITMLKNIGQALTLKFIISRILKIYTKSTKNLVDDNVVALVEGSLDGDIEKMQAAIAGLTTELAKMAAEKRQ